MANYPAEFMAGLQGMAESEATSYSYRNARVTYEVCDLCGGTKWIKTDLPSDGGVVAEAVAGHRCDECKHVRRMHPEVFAWVCGVLQWHHERHHPEAT